MVEKTIPNKYEAVLQLLYFGVDSKGNFFSEKWTCPPDEFRKHMEGRKEYEDVIKLSVASKN